MSPYRATTIASQMPGPQKSRQVIHLQIYKPGFAAGVVTNTTLCGRVSNASDDLNNTDMPEEVTCKFCRRQIEQRSPRFVKWHGWKPEN